MDELIKYFPHLTPTQLKQFAALGSLYPEWNEKINVISRKDIDNLYVHHILHSLSIAKFLTPKAGTNFMDMGTGGGFPGIPLAIIFPECNFHLIDRTGKKIKVAQNISEELGLVNVTFQHGDVAECHEKYEYIVSRAVMDLESLIKAIKKNISHTTINHPGNGLICLKGGDLESEINKIKYPTTVINLDSYFKEEFFKTKKLIYVEI